MAEIFSRDLAYQGIWIISGMARGIDSICHRGALSAGGKTLAVLGSGIDMSSIPVRMKDFIMISVIMVLWSVNSL